MRVIICGMSGFVGSALEKGLKEAGHEVQGLRVRDQNDTAALSCVLEESDILINLAGANILGRWSSGYKKLLRESRLQTTQKLVEAIKGCANPPHTLLNASAVGVYDSFHQHDESSIHYGEDFLADLVRGWEHAALKASSERTRVCLMRFGVVYGQGGGAMEKMLPPFRFGLGGRMGDGYQMISWIHVDDLVRAADFLIGHDDMEGIINFTSPEPISNLEQTRRMAKILGRPAFFHLPEWLVKLAFGEGSSVMLDSKEVYPRILQEAGFEFSYPTFDSAMEQIARSQG